MKSISNQLVSTSQISLIDAISTGKPRNRKKNRTRMTRIGRISADRSHFKDQDPRESASYSVRYVSILFQRPESAQSAQSAFYSVRYAFYSARLEAFLSFKNVLRLNSGLIPKFNRRPTSISVALR